MKYEPELFERLLNQLDIHPEDIGIKGWLLFRLDSLFSFYLCDYCENYVNTGMRPNHCKIYEMEDRNCWAYNPLKQIPWNPRQLETFKPYVNKCSKFIPSPEETKSCKKYRSRAYEYPKRAAIAIFLTVVMLLLFSMCDSV